MADILSRTPCVKGDGHLDYTYGMYLPIPFMVACAALALPGES